jgi:ADP-ribose pyrophosphatase
MSDSDIFEERLVDSKPVFSGRILSLKVDTVSLPGGSTATREVVEHNGAVAMVAIDADGKLILVRQYRYPIQCAIWEIPAGRLERGEDPAVCAERELTEEVGLRPQSLDLLSSLYVAPGYSSEAIHIFLARDLVEDEADPDEDENIECTRVSFDEACEMCRTGEIRDAKTIAGIFLALKRLGQ